MPLALVKTSRGNTFEFLTNPMSKRSSALPLGSLGPRWIEGAPNQLLGLGRGIISITVAMLTWEDMCYGKIRGENAAPL